MDLRYFCELSGALPYFGGGGSRVGVRGQGYLIIALPKTASVNNVRLNILTIIKLSRRKVIRKVMRILWDCLKMKKAITDHISIKPACVPNANHSLNIL